MNTNTNDVSTSDAIAEWAAECGERATMAARRYLAENPSALPIEQRGSLLRKLTAEYDVPVVELLAALHRDAMAASR